MGATNQIKGTNLSLQLDDKKCPQCNQLFTQQEIDDRNFDIWFDTTNDVSLIPMEELAKKSTRESLSTEYFRRLYFPFRHDGYQFTIWIRSIEHECCPDTEKCQGCYEKFRTNQLKEKEGYWWCKPCQPSAGFTEKEVKHE